MVLPENGVTYTVTKLCRQTIIELFEVEFHQRTNAHYHSYIILRLVENRYQLFINNNIYLNAETVTCLGGHPWRYMNEVDADDSFVGFLCQRAFGPIL